MFCKNCGQELGENVKFCAKCGTAVNDTADATFNQSMAVNQQVPKKKKGKVFPKLIIGFIILCGIFGMLGTDEESESEICDLEKYVLEDNLNEDTLEKIGFIEDDGYWKTENSDAYFMYEEDYFMLGISDTSKYRYHGICLEDGIEKIKEKLQDTYTLVNDDEIDCTFEKDGYSVVVRKDLVETGKIKELMITDYPSMSQPIDDAADTVSEEGDSEAEGELAEEDYDDASEVEETDVEEEAEDIVNLEWYKGAVDYYFVNPETQIKLEVGFLDDGILDFAFDGVTVLTGAECYEIDGRKIEYACSDGTFVTYSDEEVAKIEIIGSDGYDGTYELEEENTNE